MKKQCFGLMGAILLLLLANSTIRAQADAWVQWGGAGRDFVTSSRNLANSWPASGPPKIWERVLGDGYSGIAVEGTTLYTAYRRGSKDVVVAINTLNGSDLWEYAYEAPFSNAFSERVGPGPYAMPQIFGEQLIAVSGAGKIHSVDKKTGRVIWSRDIYSEFGGTQLLFGYSCHALPYKDYLIFLAGGTQGAVIALRKADGSVAWKNLEFKNAHSSPILINVDGQRQVVALLAAEVVGFSPENGALLWRHPHPTLHGLAVSTPVWAKGNLLFVSSAYEGGSRVLQLRRAAGKTSVRELWHDRHVKSHFGTVISQGEHVYLSSGHDGPAFMTCVNLRSGKIVWQRRGFAKAQLLSADGKLILLDEDGTLALLQVTPRGLDILAQAPIMQGLSWTPPTLTGTRLYVGDRQRLIALELARTKAINARR